MSAQNWYPQFADDVPYKVREAFRIAFTAIYGLRDMVTGKDPPLPPTVTSSISIPAIIQDLHVNRDNLHPAANFPSGSLYFETDADRPLVYINGLVNNAPAWVYKSGVMRGPLANLPTDLTTPGDVGFLYYTTDYKHVHRFKGTPAPLWEFAPDDDGSHYVQWDTDTPNVGTWHLMDGTAGVVRSNPDGTTTTVTLPNMAGVYAKGGNAYTGTVNPAVAPTVSGGSTGNAATGITLAANTGNAPTGETVNTGNANIGNDTDSPDFTAAAGGTQKLALKPHTHVDSGHTHGITDPQHRHSSPALTDPQHQHTISGLTSGTNGEPANLVLLPWYRL